MTGKLSADTAPNIHTNIRTHISYPKKRSKPGNFAFGCDFLGFIRAYMHVEHAKIINSFQDQDVTVIASKQSAYCCPAITGTGDRD